MKKAYSFRLSDEAILAIRVAAKERGSSEAAVVEGWALAQGSSAAERGSHKAEVAGSIPAPATITGIAPKGSFSLEQLKALVADKREEPVSLPETPSAPFDVNIEGEAHRVRQIGKKLMLLYIGPDGENPIRPLADGELEKLWEKRIK